MTLAQLKAAVSDWANRTDLTAGLLLSFLELAEQQIYEGRDGLRVQSMLITGTLTPPAALPTQYVGMDRVVWVTGGQNRVLQYLPSDAFASVEGQSGHPSAYTIRGGQLLVAPGSQPVQAIYYARPVQMALDADTNAVIDRYPSVYLYAMLMQVAEWLRDPEMLALYQAKFEQARARAARDDEFQRRGGTPLVISTDQTVRA